MKQLPQISSICSTPRRKLCLAIAAQMMLSAGVKAAPIGGTIVGGDGSIDHAGLNTTIIQNSDRLAVDWESFNIAAEERVQFIQPDSSSVALNRILGNDASQIFGRLDANGHVILMNPNGVLFGENATVNVGGLVASGLSINASDFMNGDFALRAIEGTDGTVINRGIINAATGGNVALIGRQVDNQGLISAKLGSVNLAAGKEAVLTFDNEGLLGVRVTQEILQSDLGVEAAVSNSGEISAEGGRILLTGSVSQDIFSQAVNSDGLNAKTSVVMHEDGSFTLGAGADVVNTGTLSTSSDTHDSGQIVVLGENINNSGAILATNKTANAAGNIEIHSRDTTLITEQSQIRATNDGAGSGGQIKILGDRVGVLDQSHIDASGTNGGGDINIGGGFQGKETQLRNATRTVVGKEALIEANAITQGDGGDVIVWADETTSFTGEINVRGGEFGGDGGFVEVSGKENLRFLGNVDRTAVRGKSGTLLLDPETVAIVHADSADHDGELSDGEILLSDEPADESSTFLISDTAISSALASGDVFIRATKTISSFQEGTRIAVDNSANTSSLILESGGSISLTPDTEIELGLGDFIAVGSIDGLCSDCEADITVFTDGVINTQGSIYFFSARHTVLADTNIGRNFEGEQSSLPDNLYLYGGSSVAFDLDADLELVGSLSVETLAQPTLTSIALPSGASYEVPKLKLRFGEEDGTGTILSTNAKLGRKAEITVGTGFYVNSDIIDGERGADFSGVIVNSSSEGAQFVINSQDAVYLPQIGYDFLGNPSSSSISVNVSSSADIFAEQNIYTTGGSVALSAENLNFGNSNTINTTGGVPDQGDILLEAASDISLGKISSGNNLEVASATGNILLDDVVVVSGETKISASSDIIFSETSIFLPEKNVFLSAGRDIHFNASSDISDPGFLELDLSNPASFIFNAGRSIAVESGIWLGTGDFIASAGTAEQLPSEFPIAGSTGAMRTFDGPGIYVRGIDRSGKIVLRSAHTIYAEYLSSGSSDTEGFIGLYANGSVFLPYAASSNGNFEVYNYAGAENSISEFQLSNGSTIELANIASFGGGSSGEISWVDALFDGDFSLATGGGDFYLKANVITHFGGTLIDTSSDNGHGNITLIARDKIQAPPIRYSNAMAGPQSENTKITIQAAQVLLDRDFDFNNAGIVDLNILSEGDVILGVIRGDEHDASTGGLFGTQPAAGRIFDSNGEDADQLNVEITAKGTVFQKYDLFTGGGNYSASASAFQFNDLVVLSTDGANENQDTQSGTGHVLIQAHSQNALVLPGIISRMDCLEDACGNVDVVSQAGSIYSGLRLEVGGETRFRAEKDITLFGDLIFDPKGNVFFNSGETTYLAASQTSFDDLTLADAYSSSFVIEAGGGIVAGDLYLGNGDFIASANNGVKIERLHTGARILLRSVGQIDWQLGAHPVEGFEPMSSLQIYTDEGVVMPAVLDIAGDFTVHAYAGAANLLVGDFNLSDGESVLLPELATGNALQYDGRVDWWTTADGVMATNGGDLFIRANEIDHLGASVIDTSSLSGHGNITLIARDNIQAPPIRYSKAAASPQSENTKITIQAGRVLWDRDFDFNNAGVVDLNILSEGDVILGVIRGDEHDASTGDLFFGTEPAEGRIFDSVGTDSDQLNIEITSGGKVFQKYDVFTGGGNYTATALEFSFNNGVQINSDFSNIDANSLTGVGSISLIETGTDFPISSRLVLPSIRTQGDCLNLTECGDLIITTERVISDQPFGETGAGIDIKVFGDASFNTGAIDLLDEINNIQFDGLVSVEAGYVSLSTKGGFTLGNWNVNGTAHVVAEDHDGRNSDLVSNSSLNILSPALFGTNGDLILQGTNTRFQSRAQLHARRVLLDHDGDLSLEALFLSGGTDGEESIINVSGSVISDPNSASFVEPGSGRAFSLDIIGVSVDGFFQDASPVVFNVTGDLLLSSPDNRLSSIQVVDAKTVQLTNSADMNIAGINAQNFHLETSGNVTQSSAITAADTTVINASSAANVNLDDPLNEFNFLSVESTGTSVINIADSGTITLSTINLDGAGQGGELSVMAASITQAENNSILLQDGAQLNLTGDFITLGANGTSTVDIKGAILNGVFANNLNIQGAIRGEADVTDTRLAGFYINGSAADNFVEIAAGASISGDFREGSSIAMGDGDDIANIAGDVAISIEGGAGQDTFTIAPNINVAQIVGGEDLDILNGPDANSVWTIRENGDGTLNNGNALSLFADIERINGGDASDEFIIESASVALELDGGAGSNRLTASPNDSSINNQWIVGGINSGSLNELILFSSVQSLVGNGGADNVTFVEGAQIGDVSTGLGDDVFTLATNVTAGLLDGGEGQDAINLNGLDSTYTYLNVLIDSEANYAVVNFEIENNEGGNKTIVGVDGYNAEWTIDGDGSVVINATQGGVTETNRFTGVTRLEGASGDDTFILQGGYIADRIVGGQGGSDTLVADTSLLSEWSIDGVNSGSIQIVEADREQLFEAINNLVGGAGEDVFNILSGADFNGSISGGAGTNSLAIIDPAANSVWTIASTNNVRIESSDDVASQITFSEIQALIGNENEDVLDLSAVAGSVDIENQSAADYSIQNFDTFVSNGGSFRGANRNSIWSLDQISIVSFIDSNGIAREKTFSGFKDISAGEESDTFYIKGNWFSEEGNIYAFSEIQTVDRIEMNIADMAVAWSFSSTSTRVYLDVDSSPLFEMSHNERVSELGSRDAAFALYGFEEFIGSEGSDLFLTYADVEEHQVFIDGRGGNDFLIAWNWGVLQDIVWNISRDFGGDINSKLDFDNIENVKSDDFLDFPAYDALTSTFNVSAGVLINRIIGDSHDTTFNIGSGAIIGSISDNGGIDTITVAGGANTWQLTESGGQLNSTMFSGIEILNGGSGADDFILTASTTPVAQINGGDGVNTLTAFDQANNWILNAVASTLNDTLQFDNISNLIGGANVDTFAVNESGLSFNIDAGAGVDELRGWEQQNTWVIDEDYAGNLNGTISFTNVEHLQGGALVDEFVIADGASIGQVAGGDGNDVITLGTGATAINIFGEAGSDSVVLGDLVSVTGMLDGGVGDTDALDISAFTEAFEFDFSTETTDIGLAYSNFEEEVLPSTGTSFFGGDGDTRWTFSTEDSFTIEKLDAEGNVIKSGTYSGYATLRGGNGVNAFLLSPSGNFDGAILGSADGDNNLTAGNLINRWIIDGQNRGSLEGDSTNTVFSNIANLIGGSEADSFEIVAGGSITGTIYGGAGADTLTISDASVTNNWQLGESNNVGSVAFFAEIETLIGNANNDIFNFTDATDVTAIQGGAGNNSVNWQAGDLVVDLASKQLKAIAFTDINSVTADAANTTTLIGADTENLWTLTGIDSGSVNDFTFSGFNQLQGGSGNDVLQAPDGENRWSNVDATTNSLNDALLFNGIEQLVGGAGADEFSAELVGVTAIDGGLGVNQLAASGAADDDWLIDGDNSGSFNTALVFERIQNLAGGAGNDTFTFSANSSIGNINADAGDDAFVLANNITAGILDGGGGNDTLDRGALNFIVTYLNELLEGDAVYTAENIETESSTGGSTTVRGVDGYNAQWTITGDGSLSVRAVGSNGIAVTNQFTGVTRAEGGTGTDEFILLEGGALTDGIFGDGDDSLRASDTPNIWKITAENGGELVAESGTTLLFQGIANLIGGSGSDLFDIATGGSITGSIDGSAGADRLVISDVGAANQWQLGVTNSVAQVARFQGIETITGNSGDDIFAFTGISDVTAIEGGDGNNTLLWSAGDLAVNLGTGLLNQEILFSGISSFAADAMANNTLTGADEVNSWSIDGDAAGAVSNADGSIAFSGFQTLIGGAEADTFTLAAGVNLSEIYGGAGSDVFVIGEGVIADNFYGEAGDDSFDVEVRLVLSGVLDGGSGGETEGDYINLSKYTVLDATADLETALGFAFRNFERIDNPNNRGVYFGGDGTNFWYITGANQGRLEILEGDNAGVYEFSGVHSLRGGTGEDIFIFANDAAAITTLIDGGEGAGANTLDLSAQGLINQWLLDGANSGRVINSSNAGGNIFTNIAYLIGGSGADRFELHAGGSIAGAIDGGMGNNELVVAVEQTSNWRLGEANGHSVTGVASFSNIAGLIGGTGGDIFDIFADLTDISRINGGDGSDAVNFRYDAPISVDLARGLAAGLLVEGIERFTSLNALSTLGGVEAESTWTVDGANAGSVRYLQATGEDAINVAFDGFGNLLAGAGDDRFVFAQGGSLSGTLDGGAGRNVVDLQGLTNDIHVAAAADVTLPAGVAGLSLANVDELIGNGRAWLYGASDRSYTWTIDGARSGRVTSSLVDDDNRLLAFENLSAIRGGAHDDIFQVTVATPLLSLDGGSAVTADLVDYSLVNGNLRINLAEALSGQNGVITGIEGIRGNNAGPDSLHTAELVGPDGGAIWRIGNFGGLADGVNDGEVAFGDQTISFLDFNLLTGGAGNDTFSQTSGVLLGVLNGGAGNDTFNFDLVGTNTGTRVIGGTGNDTLLLRGGQADGVLTYTAAATGGEFDYGLAGENYKVSHQDVESLLDQSLAETLEIRGSSLAETFALGNGRFQVNGGDLIEYRNKRDIAVRTGINDIIDIAENLQVAGTLTLANGTVTASDPASASITAPRLVLDSVRDVGLASARLRTSVDNLLVLNSVGDIYLQEQNGLNLAEFNANGVFDLLLLNGDLSNSAPLFSADVFRVTANNGDITLAGANQLRDDVALNGRRVELHNATTLTLMEVNAEDLILRTQRGIEGDGSVIVSGLTSIDAQGDVIFDFATNDFNKVRVTNAVNLTLVDQNAIELLDINASGAVVIRSTNNLTVTDQITGGNGVSVSSGNGSINQNGSITTNNGAVVVSAGNGEVNMSDDALIVANGGSVNINAGAGDVNMGGGTRIAANGGDVNIVAADSVVVAEVVSSGTVVLNAGTGSVSDGNGGATNVTAGGLQSSSNSGFGSNDAIETAVGNINVSTNTGNVVVNNTGAVTVEGVRTGQGDISLVNQGDVELGGNSISAQDGANGGSVDISVSQGSVTQSGSTQIPAVKGTGSVVISAPDGAIGGGGGLRVDAPIVEIIAAIKAGEIFVNPGADKIEYFSGSFKFDDQLLAIAPLEDINPAIFANVRSYFFNDISLLLPRDQRYDDDEREEEE